MKLRLKKRIKTWILLVFAFVQVSSQLNLFLSFSRFIIRLKTNIIQQSESCLFCLLYKYIAWNALCYSIVLHNFSIILYQLCSWYIIKTLWIIKLMMMNRSEEAYTRTYTVYIIVLKIAINYLILFFEWTYICIYTLFGVYLKALKLIRIPYINYYSLTLHAKYVLVLPRIKVK